MRDQFVLLLTNLPTYKLNYEPKRDEGTCHAPGYSIMYVYCMCFCIVTWYVHILTIKNYLGG